MSRQEAVALLIVFILWAAYGLFWLYKTIRQAHVRRRALKRLWRDIQADQRHYYSRRNRVLSFGFAKDLMDDEEEVLTPSEEEAERRALMEFTS
jgi:hypothetical protein